MEQQKSARVWVGAATWRGAPLSIKNEAENDIRGANGIAKAEHQD